MDSHSTKSTTVAACDELFAGDEWFDPLEAGVRLRIGGFIEAMLEGELDAALSRGRYERRPAAGAGHRHGHRERGLMGTFGPLRLSVPRARIAMPDGETVERKNATIPAFQRRTGQAEALIAGAYLSGTNMRRVPQRHSARRADKCPDRSLIERTCHPAEISGRRGSPHAYDEPTASGTEPPLLRNRRHGGLLRILEVPIGSSAASRP